MSSNILKENIERLLKERGWKLQDLERKAGTNRSIANICNGKTTHPSIDLVQKIIKVFNVSYKELLEEHNNSRSIQNFPLLVEACNKVIKEIEKLPKNIHISYDSIFTLIHEVYSYAEEFKNTSIDEQFVKWTITKYYSDLK